MTIGMPMGKKFSIAGKKAFRAGERLNLNPKLNDVLKGARDVWDNSMVAAYRTKGLRAWHDHLILHLQKIIYTTCIILSLIFLVNEARIVSSNPANLNFFYIFSPIMWAAGIDGFTFVCNAVFLCTRFVHEHHLEEFKEPRMIERICLHIIPIPTVVCIALIAYSFPRCILSNEFISTSYCQTFSYSVLNAILIIAFILSLLHSVYALYQMWFHSSLLKPKGKKQQAQVGSFHGEYLPLANDSDESGDDVMFSQPQQQQKSKTLRPSLSRVKL